MGPQETPFPTATTINRELETCEPGAAVAQSGHRGAALRILLAVGKNGQEGQNHCWPPLSTQDYCPSCGLAFRSTNPPSLMNEFPLFLSLVNKGPVCHIHIKMYLYSHRGPCFCNPSDGSGKEAYPSADLLQCNGCHLSPMSFKAVPA